MFARMRFTCAAKSVTGQAHRIRSIGLFIRRSECIEVQCAPLPAVQNDGDIPPRAISPFKFRAIVRMDSSRLVGPYWTVHVISRC